MNEVIAKAMSPALAWPRDHRRTSRPVIPACNTTSMMLWISQRSVNRFQVFIVACSHISVTPAMRSSSRASAPNALTVALDEMESAMAPPIRESSATDFRFNGRA